MNHARERLAAEAAAWRELAERSKMSNSPNRFQDWLLANGEECGPAIKVKGMRLGKIKQCYENSFDAISFREVDTDEWFYTEGVVVKPDLPLLIDHAWLTNRKGQVLDLTLRNQEDASYFGIPFKPDALFNAVLKHGYYGLFNNGITYNRDIVGKPIGRTRRAWKRKGS